MTAVGSGPVWPSMGEWVAELRSTDRRQTRMHVRRGEARSCLGVLAEMAGGKPEPDGCGRRLVFDDGTFTGLFGLKARPDWLDESTHGAAAYANDDLGWSFAEIADWLDNGASEAPTLEELTGP